MWGLETDHISLVGGASVVIPYLLNLLKTFKKEKQDFSIFEGGHIDDKYAPLERKDMVERVLTSIKQVKANYQDGKLNCVFLTGESGCGKSFLINNLLPSELTKENIRHTYFASLDKYVESQVEGEYDIIILDQFEYYYFERRLVEECLQLSDRKIIFIFAFQQKYLADIIKKLEVEFVKRHDLALYREICFLDSDDNIEGLRAFSIKILKDMYPNDTDENRIN